MMTALGDGDGDVLRLQGELELLLVLGLALLLPDVVVNESGEKSILL